MADSTLPFRVGIDLGSTTIKIVAVDASSGEVIWRHYSRHETQVAEKLLSCLVALERETGIAAGNCSACTTGSAAAAFAPAIGARFVQEVHAISLAVERFHPGVQSVIELGGQDAKIIVFRGSDGGVRKKLPSMNDKCAGGTGAVIDKIAAKLNIAPGDLEHQPYAGVRIHPIAGKCGVFAETDITGLLKQGIPSGELIASLFDAIVLQNLSVLTRGYTLYPRVILLGGPNAFLRGLREAWQHRIPETWRERGVDVPVASDGNEAIFAPPFGHCYGALGALEYSRLEGDAEGRYLGHAALEALIRDRQRQGRRQPSLPALVRSDEERDAFISQYAPPPFVPPSLAPGERVAAYLGLDAGSTSTKAVLLSPAGAVIAKAYRLSLGNPIEDAMDIIARLRRSVEAAGARVDVVGAGTTGYAKDILRDVLRADVAIAETVAHTESAKQLYQDPHVIVDVGGQDIKLIVLKDGRVKDFRLNTQCSAGNGYFLHATAESFGIPVEQYADSAFAARAMPLFGYGCALFLQSDISTFQRHGWTREEILAGLAAVLPKNVFLYVARVPNLARLGRRFILQGGTQRNLAVVKAEVDFIRESFARSGEQPEIVVHRHAGECGAIGAALEAIRVLADGRPTTFIGVDAAERIRYRTQRGPETRCTFCRNRCARTFIDVSTGGTERRVVAATCERGAQLDVAAL
ncbi:MAG TPA: BadF/BadG/BcrA/BcrD ATPase family protein, partial [Gemmatimonadaceae bacterium]